MTNIRRISSLSMNGDKVNIITPAALCSFALYNYCVGFYRALFFQYRNYSSISMHSGMCKFDYFYITYVYILSSPVPNWREITTK